MSVNAVKVEKSVTNRVLREYGIAPEVSAAFVPAIVEILNTTDAANPAHPIADLIQAQLEGVIKDNRRTAIHVASQIVTDNK